MTDIRPAADTASAAARTALRDIVVLLVAYVAFWTLYDVLTHNNLSSTPNMVENWVWGRELQWGYYKHPPLFAWVTAAWFEVFPRADWAYYLLANVVPAIGLAGVWAAIGLRERGPRRLLAVAVLMLSPLYGFLDQRFNANTMLIGVWPWAIWAFLRAMDRPTVGAGMILGGVLALGMLSKYYTFVLILGMVAALLLDPERRRLLRSPAPVAAAITGLAIFAPHALWMVDTGFETIGYARHAHDPDPARVLASIGAFTVADLLYQVPILVGVLLAVRRRRWTAIAGSLRDAAADPFVRRLLVLGIVPFAATVVLALALSSGLSALWGMPLWVLTGAILFASRDVDDHDLRPRRLIGVLSVAALVLLSAAPLVNRVDVLLSEPEAVQPNAEIARVAEETWHRSAGGQRLAIVAGDALIAGSVAFYGHDDSSELIDFDFAKSPWIDAARLDREGALAVCRHDDPACVAAAERMFGPDVVVVDAVVAKHWHRHDLPAMAVRFALKLPHGAHS